MKDIDKEHDERHYENNEGHRNVHVKILHQKDALN